MNLKDIMDCDPTLMAADKALEDRARMEKPRASRLGMGQIGDSCQRRTYWRNKLARREFFTAKTLKLFEDGHTQEDVMAARLRLVPGIVLETIDPKTGSQFEYTDHDNHFVGKVDGKITGLLQAPNKLTIWEHKCTSEKKLSEFRKIKSELGEKNALKAWNTQYHAQAILYMHYEGTDRHYMTVSSAGGRDVDSCRTEGDVAYALQLINRAKRIIKDNTLPDKISNSPDYYECRYCFFAPLCHKNEMPDRTCRLCVHVTPVENGNFHCARWGKMLSAEEQYAGCPCHIFNPALVPGEIVGTTDNSVTYKLADGSIWKDGEI